MSQCESSGDATSGEWVPFPTDLLPPVLSNFVREHAISMQNDESLIALASLVVCSSAIGNSRRFRLKPKWTEPALLWGAIVAPSGQVKSPAIDAAAEPLSAAQVHWIREYNEQLEVYKTALKEWMKLRDGRPPQPPKRRRTVMKEATVESVLAVLNDCPRGVGVIRDELAGWFGGFDRYAKSGGGESAMWLEMHRAAHVTIDRKTADKQVIDIAHAFCSVFGGIQPEILAKQLTREHKASGMAARFLFVMPPMKRKRWTDDGPSAETVKAYSSLIEALIALRFADASNTSEGGQPLVVEMDAEAKRQWIDFYNSHADVQFEEPEADLRSAFAKLEAYCARFALILHLVKWVTTSDKKSFSHKVGAQTMREAIALATWFVTETRRVYATLGESDAAEKKEQLVAWLQKRGGEITANQLHKNRKGAYPNSAIAEKALESLVAAGRGRWVAADSGAVGGRPTRKFVVAK